MTLIDNRLLLQDTRDTKPSSISGKKADVYDLSDDDEAEPKPKKKAAPAAAKKPKGGFFRFSLS